MAYTNESIGFDTIEDLKTFERISNKVSKKYVPILSSDIIDALAPEFTFVGGTKFYKYSTSHNIFLHNEETNTTIVFENSYDRSRALVFSVVVDGVYLPISIDRIVHIGQYAKSFVDDTIVNKEAILEGIKNTNNLVVTLKETKVTKEFKKAIEGYVFDIQSKRKGFQGIKLDISPYYKRNLYTYITRLTNEFLEGNYTVTVNGTEKKGTRNGDKFERTRISNKIVKYLKEEYIELFI